MEPKTKYREVRKNNVRETQLTDEELEILQNAQDRCYYFSNDSKYATGKQKALRSEVAEFEFCVDTRETGRVDILLDKLVAKGHYEKSEVGLGFTMYSLRATAAKDIAIIFQKNKIDFNGAELLDQKKHNKAAVLQ